MIDSPGFNQVLVGGACSVVRLQMILVPEVVTALARGVSVAFVVTFVR